MMIWELWELPPRPPPTTQSLSCRKLAAEGSGKRRVIFREKREGQPGASIARRVVGRGG